MPEVNVEKRGERPSESSSRTMNRRGEFRSDLSNPWNLMSMNPFALMRQFSEELDRTFGGSPSWLRSGEGSFWSPAVEVSERGDSFAVRADLPGINQNDVTVEVTPEGLVIQGERKREHDEKGSWGYRSERSYGSFCRTIPLPEGAKIEDAKAQFNNGVLEVTVPIDEQRQRRRQIPIAGASGERKPAASENPGQKQEARAR